MRRFDFVRHEGYDEEGTTSLPPGGIVVLEGLHALNPRLTEGIANGVKFRLFIEPVTQPEVFATVCLSPNDARLLRRLVRDHQYRKVSPYETFMIWPKVLAGEKKWITPFRAIADAEFDSSLCYELAVLKPYVAGLLEIVKRQHPEITRAAALSRLLEAVHATDSTKVPGDSILRETIGGSQLEY